MAIREFYNFGYSLGSLNCISKDMKYRIVENQALDRKDEFFNDILDLAIKADVAVPLDFADLNDCEYEEAAKAIVLGIHNGSLCYKDPCAKKNR